MSVAKILFSKKIHRIHCRKTLVALSICWLGLSGCQSLTGNRSAETRTLEGPPPANQPVSFNETAAYEEDEESGIRATTESSTNRVVSFMTGREPLNKEKAKELYLEGDRVFRSAAGLPRDEAKKKYEEAAKLFIRCGQAHPGSAIEQDALLMTGESYFFADRLTDAEDAFAKLQKEHPRNQHNDRAAARLFEISQYWIETEKAGNSTWMPLNFFDPARPFIDADGHAIRVLDNIRYNDPTGVLSDDATMAAGVEKMRQEKYQDADDFFTDLRQTFPDSEHQFNAHIMGLRCKLLIYAGPSYSGVMLDEADKLLSQTRKRFPDRMSDAKLSEELARIGAEIDFKKAEKLENRAAYRKRRSEYGAARVYYREILEKHSSTPFADKAREALAQMDGKPDVPGRPLDWVADLFPTQRRSKPLILSNDASISR